MPASRVAAEDVAALRRFNRFFTRHIGALAEGLHGSPYSLAEARALYEIAARPGALARDLAGDLGLDPGYLSRILKRLAAAGLVARTVAAPDRRQARLRLTAKGEAAFAPLDAAAKREAADLLAPLTEPQRRTLVARLAGIESQLAPDAAAPPFRLRTHRAGDIGHIVSRHGALYAQDYGWDQTFEGLVAGIAGRFLETFDPARERCVIAERFGAVVGSAFVVRETETVAKLRLVYVEPQTRGLGIGRAMVDECLAFARRAGYREMVLWTNDILVSARRIYEAAGFRLMREEPHRSFGKDLIGQYWARDL